MKKNTKKENFFKKIKSKYVSKEIFSFISYNKFLQMVKYNKSFQKKENISLYSYQKVFLENKISIDFNRLSIDELINFLNKEFNNFTKANDKKNLQKIIKEIESNKTSIKEKKKEKAKGKEKKPTVIQLTQNINWKQYNNKNIVELKINS